MIRDQVLESLRLYKQQMVDQDDILEIGIFGFIARNEATEDSDLDVVIRIRKPELFLLAGIKYDLEERLNRSVDIVTYHESMNQFLKKKIEQEAVYV
jgi:uncharacterized protein